MVNIRGGMEMRIAFINPQGNFDNKDSHWAQHPDFGGQLVYVKEVALSIAELGVDVDIITRRVIESKWPEFSQEVLCNYHGSSRVRVIRIPFGGDGFLNKEELWKYMGTDFVYGIVDFYKKEEKKLDAITTHYADGGIAGAILSKIYDIPFTYTAHSLGAQKMDKLGVNEENIMKIDDKFNFSKRIFAERVAMNRSYVNIVSTSQERFSQYGHNAYKGAIDVEDNKRFKVIPPGVNTEIFDNKEKDIDFVNNLYIKSMLKRDICPERLKLPSIILASRFDQKKNHIGAVLAFATNKKLQDKANLIITLRGIENPFNDYSKLKGEEKLIMDNIMQIIEEKRLLGKISMFSVDGQELLGATYRYFSSIGSIFCLTAFYEPFGLAPIEAMYAGLPVVVTQNGGPQEITEHGKYGVLVDPEDHNNIADGLILALENFNMYKKLGIDRVLKKYTWKNTAKGYLNIINEALDSKEEIPTFFTKNSKDEDLKYKLKNIYLK